MVHTILGGPISLLGWFGRWRWRMHVGCGELFPGCIGELLPASGWHGAVGAAAGARGVSGAGSGFRVGWRAAGGGGGLHFCFPGVFCWYWPSVRFGGGTGHWAVILWGLDTFLIYSNFLRSGNS